MKAWLAGALCIASVAVAGERSVYENWLEVPEAQRCERMFADLGQAPRRLHLPSAVVRFLDLAPTEPDAGPAWLLVHGYAGDLCSWGPLVAELAGQHRVLAFDLPGFGESASTDEHYTIDSYAQTLREFLDHLEVGKVHLVCHSLGGHVCIGAALTEPRYVETLTLIDTAGIYERADFVKQIAKHKGKINLGQMALRRGRSLVDWTAGEQDFLRRFIATDPAIWTAVASFRTNYRSQIGTLRTPTLILWGMDDPLFPVEDAAFLKENVPRAQLHIVDGAGHCPNESHPRTVVDLIDRFVRARQGGGP
jgi:pyruvate dehydrogenase E2 component (dihydrolipoamide acetyltransferase)